MTDCMTIYDNNVIDGLSMFSGNSYFIPLAFVILCVHTKLDKQFKTSQQLL